MIDVSCIIINFNTTNFTKNCLNSIIEMHDQSLDFEIVVVDNASRIEEFNKLKLAIEEIHDSRIKLVRSRINTGFGGGNMLGVQNAASCKYYAFINNDTLLLEKDTLNTLKSFMDFNSHIAVCSPQMVDQNKNFRVTIDHFSSLQREILRRPFLESAFPKTYLNRKKRYNQPTQVQYVQGSFMFVNAEDFNSVGGFDTNLFLYYEESDLCRRLLNDKNKATYLYPHIDYIHFKSASTNKNVVIKAELKISLLYTMRKHHGYFNAKVLLTYLQIRYLFSTLLKPKYVYLLKVLLRGAHISDSLKHKQVIQDQ